MGRQLLAFLMDLPSPEHPERTEGNVMSKSREERVPQISLADGRSCRRGMIHRRDKPIPLCVCVGSEGLI